VEYLLRARTVEPEKQPLQVIQGKADRKSDRDLKEMMEEVMNANLKEMSKEIKSEQAEMRSIVNAWIADMKDDRKETMSCQVTTEACLESKELNPEDMESEV
jgi:hypothetical protein